HPGGGNRSTPVQTSRSRDSRWRMPGPTVEERCNATGPPRVVSTPRRGAVASRVASGSPRRRLPPAPREAARGASMPHVLDHVAAGPGAVLARLGAGLHVVVLLELVALGGAGVARPGAGFAGGHGQGAAAGRQLGRRRAQLGAVVAEL